MQRVTWLLLALSLTACAGPVRDDGSGQALAGSRARDCVAHADAVSPTGAPGAVPGLVTTPPWSAARERTTTQASGSVEREVWRMAYEHCRAAGR
jgi:hypothetical protein